MSSNTVSIPRDANRVPALSGVSSADLSTPVVVAVDPATNRLLVSGAGGGGTSSTDESSFTPGAGQLTVAGGLYEATPTSLTDNQSGAIGLTAKRAVKASQVDSAGTDATDTVNHAVRVNVVAGSTGNTASSATGSAVPANGSYNALNVGGTLRGQTAVNPTGTVYAAQSDLSSIAGTVADTNSGTKSAGTLRVVLATDQPQLTNKLLVTPDANSAVNVAQIGGTNSVTGGVNGTLGVGGNVATNVAIGTNPINNGAQAISAENTAVTATRMVQLVADLTGKLIVSPYANKELLVSGTGTATGTSGTSVIAAIGAGIKIYITSISIANTGSTTSLVTIQSDPAGTPVTLWQTINPAGGGSNFTFPSPLVVPANKAVGFTAGSSSTTQYVSISGYSGT